MVDFTKMTTMEILQHLDKHKEDRAEERRQNMQCVDLRSYKNLICAAVKLACEDYMESRIMEIKNGIPLDSRDKAIKRFLRGSLVNDSLDIDGDILLKKLEGEIQKRVRSEHYGKQSRKKKSKKGSAKV